EYFFKDERYVKIDNKPLLTIWQLENKFGDVSSKEALDYLRAECVKAGFAGCEILLYSNNSDPAYEASMKASGIDGLCAYHWGTSGADVNKQLNSLTAYSALTYTVPTISVGFDYLGWGMSTKRNGLLDPADYPKLTEVVKSALAKRQTSGGKYNNMVLISTWNEYGEGTYVMPTERFGFGYLDAIRAAFTKESTAEHNDLTLTASQRQRINYLFDQNRQLLRPQLLEKEETEETDPYAGAETVKTLKMSDYSTENFASYGDSFEIKDGNLCITPKGKDPAVFFKNNFSGVPTESANAIRIRAKITGSTENVMQLFFRTSDGKDYSATKAARATLVLNQWNDYYFDFRTNAEWTGSIVNLRIDPAEYQCDYAEIESVEFIKLPDLVEEIPFTVDIIGGELSFIKSVDTTDGGLMVPLYPESGILSRMKSTYSWNKNTKELTVTNGKHTVTMTIGTDNAVVDGKAQKLYAKTYMYDGLPVIPLDTLATSLGYFVVPHEDGNGVSIMLNSAEDYNIIKTRVPYQYEFNLEGDIEDWGAQNCSISVKNGAANGVSTTYDPAMNSPALAVEAEKYPTLTIRMKWDRSNTEKNDYLGIYFKTANTGLSESRKVSVPIEASSNGEFVEFNIDMSAHLQWNGKITGIRVDPFNAPGTFEIDCIRFEKDQAAAIAEEYEAKRAANLDDTIANGDAEIKEYNPMFSDNAQITIVDRNDDGTGCYDVSAKGGKVWTYCTQKVNFTPGTTYVIEFDARMTGTNDGKLPEDGASTAIHVNLMYNGGDKRDHFKSFGTLTMATNAYEWTHFKGEITVGADCDNTNDLFGIYTNPIGDLGVSYQLDNITMTPKK
ncbi:MAG: glycoside hydrolase family 99-like domain-containing protein, partial [Eubacteriales bacterium]